MIQKRQPPYVELCKLSPFEHNKSIFHLGQCASCYSDNVKDYSENKEAGWIEDGGVVPDNLDGKHPIKKQSIQSWFIISSADGSYTSYWNGLDWDGGYFLAKRYGSRNAAMEGIVKIGIGGLYKIEEIIVIK